MKRLLPRLLLIIGGFLCALVTFGVLIQLFPDLLPSSLRKDPLDQRTPNEELRFVFTDYMGDTFYNPPGMVRPPEENRVLEDFILRYDEAGFRLPRMTADHYPIIALGDSFTEGGQIPWVDVLAESLNIPVRNLGWRGLGTLDEARIMKDYGHDDADWVLIGYFEGNDLSNIHSSYERMQDDGAILLDLTRNMIEEDRPSEPVRNPEDRYLYPLQHFIEGQTYELAYVSDYLWWLNGTEDVFRQSRNLEEFRSALDEIKNAAGDACVALVYMPSKEHIYFPYSDPAGNRRYVLENGLELRLDEAGWLSFGPLSPQNNDILIDRLDNQRNVIREAVLRAGLQFIDLTPAFEGSVFTGEPAYYPYDSHWSERGHRLAGEAVAEYISQHRDCPL